MSDLRLGTLRNRFEDYRNSASPELVATPLWEGSRTVTPTVSSTSTLTHTTLSHDQSSEPVLTSAALPTIPTSHTAPASPGASGNSLPENQVDTTLEEPASHTEITHSDASYPPAPEEVNGTGAAPEERKPPKAKET